MNYQFIPILAVSFAIALGMTPVSRQVAFRLGVIDRPKKRNITKSPTPMMGGMAIYVSFVLALILFIPARITEETIAIIIGTTIVALVGLLDDRFNLGIRVRLIAVSLAVCVLFPVGIHISLFKIPFIDLPLTIFWVLAITNAVNFLDNMDGLASGLSAIAAGYFMLIGLYEGDVLSACIGAALLGGATGFLVFNFNPASTFMGDMGALPLGYALGTLGIIVRFGGHPVSVSWMIPILVLALPVFDINLVVITRIMEGRSPGQAGKDHTSHRIMSLGYSQRITLMILYTGCFFFGLIGLAMTDMPSEKAWIVGILSIALLGMIFLFMMWVRRTRQLR